MKIGSLFDGSGGFPLAATMCGIEPVWASEIEPYPIAVTRSRFPNMKHLGDISKINGGEVEPVDIITFGSPCQDLSVAGKRAGLKHTENGDEETTRSGLFMEAVRIIKEMRNATNGKYPRYAIWENVPGAFSSNKGQDFRVVLEELVRIAEPTAVMPPVPKGGWAYADVYCGNGWSLAYRVLDAQYWGVPQRRRRIYLVADFRGQRAGKISFEREGLRGDLAESGASWQATAGNVGGGAEATDRDVECVTISSKQQSLVASRGLANTLGANDYKEPQAVVYTEPIAVATQQGGAEISENGVCPTVTAAAGMSGNNQPWVTYSIENHPADSRVNIDDSGKVQTLTSRMGTGGGNVPMVMEPVYVDTTHADDVVRVDDKVAPLQARDYKGGKMVCQPIALDRAFFNQGQNALYEPQYYEDGTVSTLVAKGPSAVAYWDGGQTCGTLTANNAGGSQRMPDKENFNCVVEHHPEPRSRYIVRRLTPTECARLQGFPDQWGHIDPKRKLTDEEYHFWLDVRNTHAAINDKTVKDYTKAQMLTWYNKLHTDSSEYKMWGNGIALPCALYVMQGIAEALHEPRN